MYKNTIEKQHTNSWRLMPRLLTLAMVAIPAGLSGQTVIGSGTITEGFDSLASGLPANWTLRTGATAGGLGTAGATFVSAATSWGTTTGNFRNVASALNAGVVSADSAGVQSGYADRALGVRQTGSFGDPGAAFTFHVSTLGVEVTDIRFSAQILSAQNYSTIWTLQYGLGETPTNFTSIGDFSDPGVFGATTVIASSFGSALDNQANVWLRVVALSVATGSGSRDTFGIDNFSITATAVPEPATVALAGGMVGLGWAAWRRRRRA